MHASDTTTWASRRPSQRRRLGAKTPSRTPGANTEREVATPNAVLGIASCRMPPMREARRLDIRGSDADLRVSLPRRTPLRGRPAVLRRPGRDLRGLRPAGAARALRARGALQGEGLLLHRLRAEGRQWRKARGWRRV